MGRDALQGAGASARAGRRQLSAQLNALWGRALIEELRRGGARYAVVCPGSRSTPLALACAGEPGLSTFSVVDERSAAFFALGLAKESQAPALLVATSGTAGAHFLPALIEASASRVPLVALTGDRPWELQGWGAAQTIDQHGLFGRHAGLFVELGLPEASDAALLHLRATAARAVAHATFTRRGPVHLNVPFREPLAPDPRAPEVLGLSALAREGRGEAPLTRLSPPRRAPDPGALEALSARLSRSERGVLVVGPRDGRDGLGEAARALGRARGVPVLAEAASQARAGGALAHYDLWLRDPATARALRPDWVLRFGGGLTSRVLQAWLDGSGAETVQVSDHGALQDPAHAAAWVLEGDAVSACEAWTGSAPAAGSFALAFEEAERRARAALEEAFARDPALSEPRIAREVVAALPPGARLFVSSSMPIRDVDAFGGAAAAGVRVLASRGANGIDGIISSALGTAAASGAPTVLLTGDLAFLHDLGGLLTARRHRLSLTVVVVNNDGGGIFSYLPIAERGLAAFEELFATPHGLELSHAAALFGASHQRPERPEALREAVAIAARGGLHLIEVRVGRAEGPRAHRALWDRVALALEGAAWS